MDHPKHWRFWKPSGDRWWIVIIRAGDERCAGWRTSRERSTWDLLGLGAGRNAGGGASGCQPSRHAGAKHSAGQRGWPYRLDDHRSDSAPLRPYGSGTVFLGRWSARLGRLAGTGRIPAHRRSAQRPAVDRQRSGGGRGWLNLLGDGGYALGARAGQIRDGLLERNSSMKRVFWRCNSMIARYFSSVGAICCWRC
jgi:hypothetical protein